MFTTWWEVAVQEAGQHSRNVSTAALYWMCFSCMVQYFTSTTLCSSARGMVARCLINNIYFITASCLRKNARFRADQIESKFERIAQLQCITTRLLAQCGHYSKPMSNWDICLFQLIFWCVPSPFLSVYYMCSQRKRGNYYVRLICSSHALTRVEWASNFSDISSDTIRRAANRRARNALKNGVLSRPSFYVRPGFEI